MITINQLQEKLEDYGFDTWLATRTIRDFDGEDDGTQVCLVGIFDDKLDDRLETIILPAPDAPDDKWQVRENGDYRFGMSDKSYSIVAARRNAVEEIMGDIGEQLEVYPNTKPAQ